MAEKKEENGKTDPPGPVPDSPVPSPTTPDDVDGGDGISDAPTVPGLPMNEQLTKQSIKLYTEGFLANWWTVGVRQYFLMFFWAALCSRYF